MADPNILRANERYKAVSSITLQIGSALIAASLVKIYFDKTVSWEPLLWLFFAFPPIFVGFAVLGLLEAEA